MAKWQKTKYPGVRYRLHETRKHKKAPDRYFTIRFMCRGKTTEEGIGWASQGWTAEEVNVLLSEFRKNSKTGDGPTTFKEKNYLADEREKQEETEEKEAEEKLFQLGEAVTEYKDWLKAETPGVYKRECQLIKYQLFRFFSKDTPIRNLAEKDISAYKQFLMKKGKVFGKGQPKPLAPRSVEFCLMQVGKIFKYHNLPNVAANVKTAKYDNKAQRFLGKEEAGKLLAEVRRRSIDLYNISILSLHMGLRAGEILGLNVAHVDFSQGVVRAFDTKNKTTRTIFMTTESERVLRGCCKEKKASDLVFPSREGKRRKAISSAWMTAVNELKLNEGIVDSRLRVKFHTLRHTYASWLIMSGKVDLYTLQKLLGHLDITTTQRYAHLAPDHYRESASVMDSEFAQVDLGSQDLLKNETAKH